MLWQDAFAMEDEGIRDIRSYARYLYRGIALPPETRLKLASKSSPLHPPPAKNEVTNFYGAQIRAFRTFFFFFFGP